MTKSTSTNLQLWNSYIHWKLSTNLQTFKAIVNWQKNICIIFQCLRVNIILKHILKDNLKNDIIYTPFFFTDLHNKKIDQIYLHEIFISTRKKIILPPQGLKSLHLLYTNLSVLKDYFLFVLFLHHYIMQILILLQICIF